MIWLVGMMGSGKSSVGAAVAAAGGLDHIDTDALIENRSDSTIARLFDSIGEPTFRLFESAVVKEIADTGGEAVVSTGGGVILDAQSVRRMRDSGCVVWLSAATAELAGRVGSGEGRPLIGDDTENSLDELLVKRAPLYREAAHHTVETAGRGIDDIAREVLELCHA